ncbi:MAG: glycoside hydrolase family 95 protein [Thermoflavifilum aggregans]|nr:glycoside hydrolase family 95 protein [Thermoflavifilum aggregans]
MKKKLIYFSLVFFIAGTSKSFSQQDLRLWYNKPANGWLESVPLGNGRLGAMPDGGILEENIVLNDITLWSGAPQDADREGASKYLPEIRKLIFEGKNDSAEALVNKVFICKGAGSGHGHGANVPYGSYQVLGNLHLKYQYGFDSSAVNPKNYFRELSLDSAIARCSFVVDGVTYQREYFTSFNHDVIIMRLTADQPGKINFTLSLNRPERYTTMVNGDELDMSGQLNNGTDGRGMKYLTRVKIKNEGGALTPGDSTLQITGANSAIIYISSATDFRDYPFILDTRSILSSAMNTPYETEKAAHIKTYQALFDRAKLSLKNFNMQQSALPTDARLRAFVENPSDNGLPVLYFQFGRYLLISSTRPDLLPPNLQGLWANTIQTPWNGDYHLDINIQMNHWPLNVTNLPMLNEPFYTLVKGLVKPGEKTAKAYYNGNGWVAHVITNVWGYTSPGESASWGATNSGSGWLCEMLWQHYLFTMDQDYLKKIYPILKGSAEFYLSTLVKDPNNGWLVTAPSNSPENAFRLPNGKVAHVCAGPTIDNQIIRELFTHVIDASGVLGKDNILSKRLSAAKEQLPPNQIGPEGRLMEWLKPYEEVEPHHRHVSPLWGMYPGNEISLAATPEIAQAAEKLLIRRGDISTGWSIAWKINLWARLHDGNHCFKLLRDLLRPTGQTGFNMSDGGGVYPNLFNAHPPFQIDGNFGGTAGIAEMLVQSQNGYIEFLPALPDQWPDGSFAGLCVRGGGVVSASWTNKELQSATLEATVNYQFGIQIPDSLKGKLKLTVGGKTVRPVFRGNRLELKLKKGEKAELKF